MNKKSKFTLYSEDYKTWLSELKDRVRRVQLKAATAVNRELLQFYWELGAEIVEKQKKTSWGQGFLNKLSRDLMAEFPDMKGFSLSNIKYIRQWYLFYADARSIGQQAVGQIAKQPVSQITRIPWGHNLAIIAKCKDPDEALYYVKNTIRYGWSRSVLTHQIESGLWNREGKSITNFSRSLPSPQSDLARQTLKDPYVFDFLALTKDHDERELEQGLIDHITRDNPTIGILLCKTRDTTVVEYALSDIHKPIGVSKYRITKSLPKGLKSALPTVEEIEAELSPKKKRGGKTGDRKK